MICQKCNNEGIKNSANHNEFWYCNICKEEILSFNASAFILATGLARDEAFKQALKYLYGDEEL